MESISTTSSYIIAFWVSGVFMSYILLWRPAMKVISVLEPDNVAYRYRFLGCIVFHLLCAIALPVMIHILLLDSFRERFLKQFIPAFLGKTDE